MKDMLRRYAVILFVIAALISFAINGYVLYRTHDDMAFATYTGVANVEVGGEKIFASAVELSVPYGRSSTVACISVVEDNNGGLKLEQSEKSRVSLVPINVIMQKR